MLLVPQNNGAKALLSLVFFFECLSTWLKVASLLQD